jgi:hypothetical protein
MLAALANYSARFPFRTMHSIFASSSTQLWACAVRRIFIQNRVVLRVPLFRDYSSRWDPLLMYTICFSQIHTCYDKTQNRVHWFNNNCRTQKGSNIPSHSFEITFNHWDHSLQCIWSIHPDPHVRSAFVPPIVYIELESTIE